MTILEDLKKNTLVRFRSGPRDPVQVVDVTWIGNNVIELFYKDTRGQSGTRLVYRDQESELELLEEGVRFAFDQDGDLFRLSSEARRIGLAHLFDPYLALHTSDLMPLPHQITAVYEVMLQRQPLRFLLADDPGSGKTIMTGLLIKELMARSDLKRCFICCPGNLVEQWQDELANRFQLNFEIVSRTRIEESRTGNPFQEINLAIGRLDQICRNDDLMAKLERADDWDLVVVDEAHKMAAHIVSRGDIKRTKRYRLGELLGRLTRHLLLLTATPHNGKEEDFQLFLALLDSDRFEGRFRDGVHTVDASDLMRRMVKEKLYKFDGTPLFPERRTYSVKYKLSDREAELYKVVTTYIREEMNRVDRFTEDGRKRVAVGFALTVLQRRLASSPAAIHKSLERRHARLKRSLEEAKFDQRTEEFKLLIPDVASDDKEDFYDWIDDAPDDEVEELEDNVVGFASAASTIRELEIEIKTLAELENLAEESKNSGEDRKWEELSRLLQDKVKDADGNWRKLIIFSEHKDTVDYLTDRLRNLLGRQEAVVTITGSMNRELRRNIQERFRVDPEVAILVATDAAGEGINLQRAHLMVNYDLPWNPNRIEQRFGRIHRIGQEEVCHMFNLVAEETREGDVFITLLEKLDRARESLGGQVYDVLGQVFRERSLRDLMMDAIKYGEQPEVIARLNRVIEGAFDGEHIQRLLEQNALTDDAIDKSQLLDIKEKMERAEARRLQPYFIASFFLKAFRLLGGKIHRREKGRFEVTHVPPALRARDRVIGIKAALQRRYERVTFEQKLVNLRGKPQAVLMAPGHPLMNVVLDIIGERYGALMKKGTVLVDPRPGEGERVLFYLEHSLSDSRPDGRERTISKRMHFVEMDEAGNVRDGGPAPYLDYRNPTEEERKAVQKLLKKEWLRGDLERQASHYAVTRLVPEHLQDVRERRLKLIDKTEVEVKKRLMTEIGYWDHRGAELREKELAGRQLRFMNSAKAWKRAEELRARLETRLAELARERNIMARPPVVSGGALVVPASLLARLGGFPEEPALDARETERVERLAMEAVMAAERGLGYEPRDVGDEYLGYDVESRVPGGGKLRFIEVKGRVRGATKVTVTRNEILVGLNKPQDFILAVVLVDGDRTEEPVYVRQPFDKEPDFSAHSVNYHLKKLLRKGGSPA